MHVNYIQLYRVYMHTLGAPVLNQDIGKNEMVLNTVFDH